MDDNLPDRSGTVIAGRYRLVKRLGAGGMGEVYRAVNEMVHREVAIKILKPEYAKSQDVVARVLREARAANAVRHPNVVDVLDVQTDDEGAPVIVQELLSGQDLAEFLRARGRALTEAEALELMIPVTEALAAAHTAGIMHRDLKLENIFLDRQQNGSVVPKVLDFGLSRGVGESAASRLTATGVAMGTPMYMSPEQVQGQRDVDQRTDVWALGIMLYELVAGRLPFEGESLGAIFVKVCTVDPAPLRSLAPQVSEAYERVVTRCLRRERAERYENAGELAADLRRLRAGADTAVHGSGAAVMARAQTISANALDAPPSPELPPSASTLRPAGQASMAAAGTMVAPAPASTPSARTPLAQSIGPTVSAVPPTPRRPAKVVVVAAAAVTCGVVAVAAWLGLRNGPAATTALQQPPHVARPAVTPPAPPPPAAPVAPAAGTAAYDGHPPAPAGTGTPAYDGTAHPAPAPAQPATTAYDPDDEQRSARRGRRGRRGRDRGNAAAPANGNAAGANGGGNGSAGHAATPTIPGGGTTAYDGD